MQAVSNSFHQKSNSNVRKHKWGILMSFDKDFNSDREFFILDTSLMSGGDVITPVGDSPIQFWDFYQYESLADRVVEMSWEREAEFPYSVQSSVASVTLSNHDGYFSAGSTSPIANDLAPGRPMKVLAGYEGEPLLQQFVGLTQESPEVDYVERTAQFESLDYLTEIFKLDLHESIAMSNVRTDEVLSALFEQFGVESYQYDFAIGRNRIPFLYVEAGKNAADVMREAMQAEGGQLWIDEQGIIKFRPRLVTGDEPVATFDESKIVTLNSTGDNKIINRVSIRSKIRSIQNPQPIHTGSGETNNPEIGSPIEVPAYSEVVYTIDLDDPLAGYSEPSLGRLSNDSWFLCRTKGGANVSSGVSVVDSHLSFEDLSITFNNTNGFPVEVNAIEVYGEPAKTVDVINFEAFDQDSIDRYGDQLLEIESDMFGSESNCESLAYTVIDTYSKPDNSIEMSVKGNPALQLNDIIIVETSKISGHFQITKLQSSISASGTEQIISAKRYHPREWFILNVSLLNGEHVLAP